MIGHRRVRVTHPFLWLPEIVTHRLQQDYRHSQDYA